MRVLHCPEIVGGNALQLARAERELGIDSRQIVFQQNYIGYPADEVLLPSSAGLLARERARWKMLRRALAFDVIHYNFGQSIMPSSISAYSKRARSYPKVIQWLFRAYAGCLEQMDLPIFRWLGKTIIVTYQGDDARQGGYCREHFSITFADEVAADYYTDETDRLKRKRIATFDKYADYIFALNPDLMHVLPNRTKFLPYSSVDLREWQPVMTNNIKPVVLHAPSHREIKGTKYILAAVDRLRDEGIEFEFVLIEGMSNEEARVHYERADLLVDQLLAGWYGGLAVELMALGKPVMAYLREDDLGFIAEEMRHDLPIIQMTPDSIYSGLKYWLTEEKEKLPEIGVKSRAFVEKWHDPHKLAQYMKVTYETSFYRKESGRKAGG